MSHGLPHARDLGRQLSVTLNYSMKFVLKHRLECSSFLGALWRTPWAALLEGSVVDHIGPLHGARWGGLPIKKGRPPPKAVGTGVRSWPLAANHPPATRWAPVECRATAGLSRAPSRPCDHDMSALPLSVQAAKVNDGSIMMLPRQGRT